MTSLMKVEHRNCKDSYTMYTAKDFKSMCEYFTDIYRKQYGAEVAEAYGRWAVEYSRFYEHDDMHSYPLPTQSEKKRKKIYKRLRCLERRIIKILQEKNCGARMELNAKINFTDIGAWSRIWDTIPTIE